MFLLNVSVIIHKPQVFFSFSDDHRMLVEPACGASLACVYERLFKVWQEQGKLGELKSALVIVCGGNIVSLNALKEWKEKLGLC